MNLPLYTLSESESENELEDYDPAFENIQISSLDTKEENSKKSLPALKVKDGKRKKQEKSKTNNKKTLEKDERKNKPAKSIKPAVCTQDISLVIDPQLLTRKFGGELLTAMQTAGIQYDVQEQKIPSSISWMSKSPDLEEKSQVQVVIVWTWEELIRLITTNTLTFRIKECKKSIVNDKITLIIFGIEEYFRIKKTLKNREIKRNIQPCDKSKSNKAENVVLNTPILSRIDLEATLVELQLLLDLQWKFMETGQEIGLFITQFTKAVIELPHKLERNRRQECTEWFAVADSKGSVRVDNSGNGLMRLWQQQLCQFPNVGLDVAQAIVSNYNSPQVLIEAYNKCPTPKEGELLLQNIPIRRVQGPLTAVRKIGPELSKKVYRFFNSKDGNVLLSQEN